MTRAFTKRPVWTWVCDKCGREQLLAREQSGSMGLPSPDEMCERGWFIAQKFGDLCPLCVLDQSADSGEAER